MLRRAASGRRFGVWMLLAIAAATGGCARDASDTGGRILLGTTHTLEDSGILDSLAASFRARHPDQQLKIVVAGSGEVLSIARRGDLDVILTHSPADEQAFMAGGNGVERRAVMHNAFVIAGPTSDPAQVAHASNARDAFARIRTSGQRFISRGDESGTHRMERSIWEATGAQPDWDGYEEAGSGMAEVLRVASQRDAYTLTDAATLAVLTGTLEITTLFAGDPALRNEYSVITVRKAANAEGAALFADWITSPDARTVIERFGTAQYGRALFAVPPQ